MALNVGKEIAALKRMTVKELRAKHVEVFGEETPAHHKEYLVKRIAWRIQANAEGDLSEHARHVRIAGPPLIRNQNDVTGRYERGRHHRIIKREVGEPGDSLNPLGIA